jgi:hypothetical protein
MAVALVRQLTPLRQHSALCPKVCYFEFTATFSSDKRKHITTNEQRDKNTQNTSGVSFLDARILSSLAKVVLSSSCSKMTIAKYAVVFLRLLACCNSLAFQWEGMFRGAPPLPGPATSVTAEPMEWTQKYRKLIPYEHARIRAMGLGISSKEEYDKFRSSYGPYLPTRPHEMYKEEWTSWGEFLGAMGSYESTQVIVRNVLKLTSMEAYLEFVTDHPKRAQGLKIPARPDVYYKSAGWKNSNEFFAKSA